MATSPSVTAARARRWTWTLVLAAVVESVLAAVLRAPALQQLWAGERQPTILVAVLGLVWLLVLLVIVLGTVHALVAPEQRAARRDEALAAVAATSHEWVWESDAQLRLTYTNDRVRDLLGYEPDELYGRAMPTLLTDEGAARARATLSDSARTHEGWSDVELAWRHAEGHPVLMQGGGVPILDDEGVLLGFRGSRRLVTSEMSHERAIGAARQRLSELLRDGTLSVALQPVVSLATGRVAGVEALARFDDGRGPDQWFSEARDTGQGCALDRLAFRTALRTLASLPPEVYLSVNATPELLLDPAFGDELAATDLPLDQLVIEITEHVEIFQYDEITAALCGFRERGGRLAIDDTGAGYASFNHVLQLRPDIIKIDRSLVANVDTDPARRSLITALVLLALDMDASVTAEGVEQDAELTTLQDLGIDHAQGYLLARPAIDPQRWRRWWSRIWLPDAPSAAVRPA